MTLLVGNDGSGWTNSDVGVQNASGNEIFFGQAAVETGTATTAYVYISGWGSSTSASVAIYNNATNALIAESATIASSAGTGLKSAAISASITASTTYTLVLFVDGYIDIRTNSTGSTYSIEDKALGTPGSAPSTIDISGAFSSSIHKPMLLYIDGTTGGSDVSITAGAGALTIAGQTPGRTTQWYRNPGAGALTAGGYAPTFIERGLRYAYPTADVSDGTWLPSTGTDLYAAIDEEPASDTDYIYTNAAGACQIRLLPVTDPVASSGYAVNYRIWSPVGGNAVVRLKQGTTTIATWTHTGLPTSPTDYSQSLSGAEADSITDHDDLRLEFEAT